MLLEIFKRDSTDLLPYLKLNLGLEVSLCTGNASRTTSWDALRLSSVGRNKDGLVLCDHPIGDVDCVVSCWDTTADSRPRVLDRRSLRQKVVETVTSLSDTDVGPDGVLRVWWPYSDEQLVYGISKKTSPWLRILKDNHKRSTWAVWPMKCLGFKMDGVFAKKCQDKDTAKTALSTMVLVKGDLSHGSNVWLDDVNIVVEKTWNSENQEAAIAKITQKMMQPLFMAKKRERKVREKLRPGDS